MNVRVLFLVALLTVPFALVIAVSAGAEAPDVPLCEPDVLPAEAFLAPANWEDGTPETHACIGKIQPGTKMDSPAWCTMNWVFRDGAGNYYIGSAGHCVGAVGQRVSILGVGSMGSVVYRLNAGPGSDFSLTKVDAAKVGLVDGTLCHWGGPTQMSDGSSDATLMHYGWGAELYYLTSATRPRLAEQTGQTADRLDYVGLTNGGDSGSPVMSRDGTALGVHTHRTTANVPFVGLTPKYGSRLDVAVDRAEVAMGVDLTLVTGSSPPSLVGT